MSCVLHFYLIWGNILTDEFEENLIDADSGFIEEAAFKIEQQQRATSREQATNDSITPTEELQEDSKENDGQNVLLDKVKWVYLQFAL